MFKSVSAAAAAVAALIALCACGNDATPAASTSSVATPTASVPTSVASGLPYYAPSPTTTTPAVSQADQQTAYAYYNSPERHALLQHIIDTVGGPLAQAMDARQLKYTRTGWIKADPAPHEGWGSIMTDFPGKTSVMAQMQVHFKDGRLDLSRGIIGLSLQKDGIVYDIRTANLDKLGNIVEDSPWQDRWFITSPAQDDDVSLKGSNDQSMDIDHPRTCPCTVWGSHSSSNVMLTRDGIIAADQRFADAINSLGVKVSDWQ